MDMMDCQVAAGQNVAALTEQLRYGNAQLVLPRHAESSTFQDEMLG